MNEKERKEKEEKEDKDAISAVGMIIGVGIILMVISIFIIYEDFQEEKNTEIVVVEEEIEMVLLPNGEFVREEKIDDIIYYIFKLKDDNGGIKLFKLDAEDTMVYEHEVDEAYMKIVWEETRVYGEVEIEKQGILDSIFEEEYDGKYDGFASVTGDIKEISIYVQND